MDMQKERQSLFVRPAALIKKRLWHRCFPVKFAKFLRTPFSKEQIWTTASVYWKERKTPQAQYWQDIETVSWRCSAKKVF